MHREFISTIINNTDNVTVVTLAIDDDYSKAYYMMVKYPNKNFIIHVVHNLLDLKDKYRIMEFVKLNNNKLFLYGGVRPTTIFIYSAWKIFNIYDLYLKTVKNRDPNMMLDIDIRQYLRSFKIKKLRYGT
jgi:hypothetical protein